MEILYQMTTKMFHLSNISFEKLNTEIISNIENILDFFGIDYKMGKKTYFGCCPIHGGDNKRAWHIYNTENPIWRCFTHGCESKYGKDMIGLIIALHEYTGKKIGRQQAIRWYMEWAKKNDSDYYVSDNDINNARFSKLIKVHIVENNKPKNPISREKIRKSLAIPSPYYLSRGVSRAILDKYDIGDCLSTDYTKEMYGRAVVPMYDESYSYMTGCSGRSVFDQCKKCELYHTPKLSCPKEEYWGCFPKWRHSKSLVKEKTLFNYWFAKKHIIESNTAILVESPGNVLKLESCGVNYSVANLGTSLSTQQILMLSSAACMNIVVIGDNDDAGRKYMEAVESMTKNNFNVFKINISGSDLAEMPDKNVLDELWPIMKKLKLEIRR